MTGLAKRLANVKPSQTKAMTQRARDLRAEGKDIIVLSQGEPDFDTPENIREAGKRAIDEGKTRYTAVAGILPLREAICRKLKRDDDLDYSPDEITVGGGAKQVLTNALLATVNPGDEVLYPKPCWTSYPDMVSIAEGKPVGIDTTKTGFKISAQSLNDVITDKTRWLMLNSPSNPTGAVYSRKDLAALADVLRRHPNVMVLADDIYEHLVYEPGAFATMAEVAPDLKDRVLTVNGVSKAHAMTGWRIGYGAGPQWLIKAMNLLQSQMTSHACSVAQYAAIEALDGSQAHLEEFTSAFRERRDYIFERLNSVPGLNAAAKPDGAFYLFFSCHDLIGAATPAGAVIENDIDFATYLLEEANVAVVPGSAFMAEGYFRASYANSMDELKEAAKRIHSACELLSIPLTTAARV